MKVTPIILCKYALVILMISSVAAGQSSPPLRLAPSTEPAAKDRNTVADNAQPQTVSINIKNTVPATPAITAADKSKAESYFDKGMKLLAAGKLIDGRKLLSEALASGALDSARADQIREKLSTIAKEMIFSPRAFPGDALTEIYTIRSGDMLSSIAGRKKLSVPYQAIQRVNSITNPAAIRVNQKIKLLKGPFNIIITKHSYRLDLYLQDIFVRSFHVGLGENNSTPLGRWKVRDRMRKAPWTSPEGVVYYPGQSEYPLGNQGIWIALQGLDTSNETFGGFGIHGTDEPDSIGKQMSNGCIRLGDSDIALLYDLLANGSAVTVRP